MGEHIAHQGTPDEFKYVIETNKDGKDDPIGKILSASSTTESDNLGVHLAALMDLPKLIDASLEGEYHAGYAKIENKRGDKQETIPVIVHRLYTAMTVKGDPSLYRVKITVKEFRDKNNEPYTYKVTEVESPISGLQVDDALGETTSVMGAKLLKGVKKSKENDVNLHASKNSDSDFAILDDEYLDAVERGDMETAERMVRDAAAKAMPETKVVDADGKPLVVYHGSDQRDITEFRMNAGAMGDGAYFTSAFAEACDYVREELGDYDLSEGRHQGKRGKRG